MTKEGKPRKKSQKQLLIEALLKLDPEPSKQRPIKWNFEMRWLGALLKKNKDLDFWFFLSRHYSFVSLQHLLPQEGLIMRFELEYQKQKFLKLNTSSAPKLEQEKIGQDIIVPSKPKTLLDFINS